MLHSFTGFDRPEFKIGRELARCREYDMDAESAMNVYRIALELEEQRPGDGIEYVKTVRELIKC